MHSTRVLIRAALDLTSLFNWNTKQVFVYLSVAYGGAKGSKYVRVSFACSCACS